MKPPSTRSRSSYATVAVPTQRSDHLSDARAEAMRVFPELENYHWHDDYFGDCKQDIIAVFDHSDSGVMAALAVIIWMLLGWSIFPTVFIHMWIPVSKFLDGLLELQLLVVFLFPPVASLIVCCGGSCGSSRYPPAHTAVSSDGLIHKPARGLWGAPESKYRYYVVREYVCRHFLYPSCSCRAYSFYIQRQAPTFSHSVTLSM